MLVLQKQFAGFSLLDTLVALSLASLLALTLLCVETDTYREAGIFRKSLSAYQADSYWLEELSTPGACATGLTPEGNTVTECHKQSGAVLFFAGTP